MKTIESTIAGSSSLEQYFEQFRRHIIGIDQEFDSPYGRKKIVYADWTASGRLYRPIEEKMVNELGCFVANTHTETTVSGTAMTLAYHEAKEIIKRHVNASKDDILLAAGTGMTGVINKFQRILGLKVPEKLKRYTSIPEHERPVVFITHMEHHSNQTSWLETIARVEMIPADDRGLICLENFEKLLEKYKHHTLKIASVTACSNVTGIQTPYHEIAGMIHRYGGVCFVDFACSAPYVNIDMHPDNETYLDAIFFSPHKFLGGPGTSGILIFNKNMYHNLAPDHPGGGTVIWTDPWGLHHYANNIEAKEDGGTPGFLQVIKAALAVRLKDEMGVDNMLRREQEIMDLLFEELGRVPGLHILAGEVRDRLGVISFCIDKLHYNLGVRLLNDRFGIQTRGGCSCAGTYGHYLLHIDKAWSHYLANKVLHGDFAEKPGWMRLSIHPTMRNEEIHFICWSIREMATRHEEWVKDYRYDRTTNEFTHIHRNSFEMDLVQHWLKPSALGAPHPGLQSLHSST